MLAEETNLMKKRAMEKPAHKNVLSKFERKLYVVGNRKKSKDVIDLLDEFEGQKVYLSNRLNLAGVIDPSAIGVVLVMPMLGIKKALESFSRSSLHVGMKIHVVCSGRVSNKQARSYYDMGACSVSLFPQDQKIFSKLMKQLHEEQDLTSPQSLEQRPISRVLSARLKATNTALEKIEVKCLSGIAHCSGVLDSLISLQQLEKTVVATPGVHSFVDMGMELADNVSVDEALAVAARNAVFAMPELKRETVTITVSKGHLIVAGTVKNKKLFEKVNSLLTQQFGIKSVENLLVISKEKADWDYLVARKIKEKLDKFFIYSNIDIKFMRNVAILQGRVNGRSKKALAEEIVKQQKPVDKVINRLQVRDVVAS